MIRSLAEREQVIECVADETRVPTGSERECCNAVHVLTTVYLPLRYLIDPEQAQEAVLEQFAQEFEMLDTEKLVSIM